MFYKIINKIKINLKLNNKYFITKLIKSDFKIINTFYKINIIKNIKKIKNEKYIITLNINSAFKNIQNTYKPSKPIKINLKNLLKINNKNNSLMLLSTNRGLINNIEAEKNKIGGFIILVIML